MTTKDTKVVSLFDKKRRQAKAEAQKNTEAEPPLSFAEVLRKNLENEERLKKERLKANKAVVRSFRLEPKR